MAGKVSCLEENVLHNFLLPEIIRDLFLWLKALYLIEVPVLLGKVKHHVLCYLYLCGSELIRFISKNKFEFRKQTAMAKGEQCMVRGRSSPKGEETSRQGQRGTEDTTLPPGHLCWAEQLMKDEI